MKIVAVAAAGVLAVVAWLMYKRNRGEPDEAFANRLIAMVRDWLHKSGLPQDEIELRITEALRGNTISTLPGIDRIEIEAEKVGSNDVDVSVLMLIAESPQPKLVRIKASFRWHELPAKYREHFLRSNEKRIQYLIYPQKEAQP